MVSHATQTILEATRSYVDQKAELFAKLNIATESHFGKCGALWILGDESTRAILAIFARTFECVATSYVHMPHISKFRLLNSLPCLHSGILDDAAVSTTTEAGAAAAGGGAPAGGGGGAPPSFGAATGAGGSELPPAGGEAPAGEEAGAAAPEPAPPPVKEIVGTAA